MIARVVERGRRSTVFHARDIREAWEARKEKTPAGSALEMAASIGIEVLNDDQDRALQELEDFDMKPRLDEPRESESTRALHPSHRPPMLRAPDCLPSSQTWMYLTE